MARLITLLLVLSACGGSKQPQVQKPVDTVAAPDAGAPARECKTGSDCAQGQDCAGPEGCDVPWTCQPARMCTMDAVEYCGCDGKTMIGSSRCPPAPYKHKGRCP